MGLTIKAGSESTFTPVPPGMHLARCYKIIDLGTQQVEYKGEVKFQEKVMIQFEVHGEDDQGNPLVTSKGEPMSISKNYTASLNDSATLRIDLKNWRGRDFTPEEMRGFELKNILGAWAMITVVKTQGRDGKEYTNIGAVMPVPANMKKAGLPDGINKTEIFDISNPSLEVYEKLSDNLKAKIQKSPEWQDYLKRTQGTTKSAVEKNDVFEGLSDDIPF